jgi:hypothetical protein
MKIEVETFDSEIECLSMHKRLTIGKKAYIHSCNFDHNVNKWVITWTPIPTSYARSRPIGDEVYSVGAILKIIDEISENDELALDQNISDLVTKLQNIALELHNKLETLYISGTIK